MALFTTIFATIANVLISAAISFAINLAVKTLTKKPKADTAALDFEQTVTRRLQASLPLEVLVGRRIVAGVGYYDDSYGFKREYAVSVTVLSAKPCTAFHQLFLDGEPVTLSGDPTTGQRNVTSHFLGKNNAQRVKVRVFLGDNNSGLGAYLASKFPNKFTSADNFGDYCVIVTECRNTNDDFDEDEGKNYIPFQGFPEVKVELTGAKICDPRNPGETYDDETTYTHTAGNSALADAQFDYGFYSGVGAGRSLIVGNGYPVALMDLPQIIDNADFCDTESFTCHGLLRSANSGDQEEIWKTYNAERVEHAASVFSIPEGNRTIVETIDMSQHLAARVSFYDEEGYSTEVYNEIKSSYAEPDEYYGEKELPLYSNPDWIASDNHIPRQMSLPLLFVTNKEQAFKLQKQEIRLSRKPATCTIEDLPAGFLRLKVGQMITLVNADVPAVNNRIWIIKGRGQSQRLDITLSLREYAGDDAFDFDPDTETPAPPITIPDPRPWSEWYFENDYASPLILNGIRRGTVSLDDVLITGRGSLIAEQDAQNENSTGNDVIQLSANPVNVFGAGTGAITTSSVTVTITGAVGSTTKVWSKVSGDDFTVNSPNSETTTFTATPGTDNSNTATYKLTVTDSETPTANVSTISVSVSVYDTSGGTLGGL